METIAFAVSGSNSFHKIELSKTLLRFAEFDFTYFWERCIEAGRNARKTGRISHNMRNMAINVLVKCHPYVEACINTEFSEVVLDCIIAYICHSEGIGLEELWARCISPKSLYEKDIFNRVSQYKTGRGINQWINIVRVQEYVRSKMNFIYETDDNIMLTESEYRTRREYFDLSFLVAANETGCPVEELPAVKKFSPSTLPNGTFMMGRMSKTIYKRLSDVLAEAPMCEKTRLNDHNRDQSALDAFSYVKDMPRPDKLEMDAAIEALSALPETVYMPDSFKAAIDLEFTCMQEEGIYMAKCPRCGRFFVRELADNSPYCKRVNSSGKTCTEQAEEELGIAAAIRNGDEVIPEPSHTLDITLESVEPETIPEDILSDEGIEGTQIPEELLERCRKVYNQLNRRIGRLITAYEFNEWAGYLEVVKENIGKGTAELVQLEEFLDYWETAVKKFSRKSKSRHIDEAAVPIIGDSQPKEQAQLFNEVIRQTEERERAGAGISPAGTEDVPEERRFKPFTPPKYNTVLEAMLDGKYKSDELLSEKGAEDSSEITVNGKKVTLPQWERITRE